MTVKRPLVVTLIALLLVLTGLGGMAFHAADFGRGGTADAALVEAISALAIIAGVFLLRAHNWARWLAMLWIAAHVVISAFHPLRELAIHIAVFAVFAVVLFHRAANAFFRPAETS